MSTTPTRYDAHRAAATEHGWANASWQALGTTVELVVTHPPALETATHVVADLIDQIDRAASRFRADSELSLLNGAAGQERIASPLFARALRVALDAAAWTDGLVDPTVGRSLLDHGYDRTFTRVQPDGPALSVTQEPAPGWANVRLDDASGAVRLPPGALIDLGATAKALASDLAVEAAAASTACGVLLSIGGDVSVAGPAPDEGWPVLICDVADPFLPAADTAGEADGEVVTLYTGGLATSGTMARRWRRGGSWVHHIVDPRTGGPSQSPWVTASVRASTCVLANAASTAAVVLGADAPRWLRAHGMAYRLVDSQRRVIHGAGWTEGTR